METEFAEKEALFQSSLDPNEFKVASEIKNIISFLDLGPQQKGFTAWSVEKLISAREKLSRYSETLGEWISYHETRSDFAYIWRKGKMASDWQPMKSQLQEGLKETKITQVEVENSLTEKYMDEQYFSMFHRRQADYLILLMEASDRMLRSIDHQLRETERQQKLKQDPSHGKAELYQNR